MEQVINNFLICWTTALVRLPLTEVKQYMFFNRRSVCVYPNYLNFSKYALHKLMMDCSETVSAKFNSVHILSASLLFEIPAH